MTNEHADHFTTDDLTAQTAEYARGHGLGLRFDAAWVDDAWVAPKRASGLLASLSTGLHRWAERHAHAQAVADFAAWVDDVHDERPTRGELRRLGVRVLEELDRLANLVADLRKDEAAAKSLYARQESERAGLLGANRRQSEALDAHRTEINSLVAQRDELIEALGEQREAHAKEIGEHTTLSEAFDELGRERDELKRRLVRAQRERDAFRVECELVRRERDELRGEMQGVTRLAAERDEWVTRAKGYAREVDTVQAQLVDTKRLRDSWQHQAKTRADAVRSLQERVAALIAERDALADARGDYVVLRLRDGKPEVLTVDTWEETDADGPLVVTVEARRQAPGGSVK